MADMVHSPAARYHHSNRKLFPMSLTVTTQQMTWFASFPSQDERYRLSVVIWLLRSSNSVVLMLIMALRN